MVAIREKHKGDVLSTKHKTIGPTDMGSISLWGCSPMMGWTSNFDAPWIKLSHHSPDDPLKYQTSSLHVVLLISFPWLASSITSKLPSGYLT